MQQLLLFLKKNFIKVAVKVMEIVKASVNKPNLLADEKFFYIFCCAQN
jgi:hypothetical protein